MAVNIWLEDRQPIHDLTDGNGELNLSWTPESWKVHTASTLGTISIIFFLSLETGKHNCKMQNYRKPGIFGPSALGAIIF